MSDVDLKVVNVVFAFLICIFLVHLKVSTASQGCPTGFTGDNCSDIDDCVNVTCSGKGNCSDRTNGSVCECQDGFYGLNCEIEASLCTPNPCENNGTCISDQDSFKCNCPPEYEGERCETERPRKIFTVRLTMVDRNYTSAYKDLTNFNTRGLISDLTEIFTQFFRGIFTGFVSITFREFFPGSVGAIFDAAFAATSDVNETSIIQALARASGKSQLRFEALGVITIENGLSTPTTAPTEASVMEPWLIALIVSLIVIFILLVIIMVLVIKYRREKEVSKGLGIVFDGNQQHWANIKDFRKRVTTSSGNGDESNKRTQSTGNF